MINGRPYGVVSGFQWKSITPKRAIYAIDSVDPVELAITNTKITGTLSVYRTNGDGGAQGWGIGAPYESLSREKYFSVMLVDRATDRVLFEARYCSLVDEAWSVPSRGIITGSLSFEALSWSNEVKES